MGGHAMSDEAKLRPVAMLSRAWQGSPLDRARALDGAFTVLYGRRVSMHLMVQPHVAAKLLGNEMCRDQGFPAPVAGGCAPKHPRHALPLRRASYSSPLSATLHAFWGSISRGSLGFVLADHGVVCFRSCLR
jgi:hypothetical protein